MLTPDLERARRFIAAHPPPGRALLCGVTGSHFYGFPSPDSDLDLKGIHLAPAAELLGLGEPQETHDVLTVFEGVEHDLTFHEARKALHMLLGGNGNVLERILTPFQVLATPELQELAAIARRSVAKSFFRHYRGFLGGAQREHARAPTAKALLYCYRVALTGVHLLRTGELVGDVGRTAPEHGFPEALELVARKQQAGEHDGLPGDEDTRHRAIWPRLESALADAHAHSPLPGEPPNRAEAHDWLVRTRLRG